MPRSMPDFEIIAELEEHGMENLLGSRLSQPLEMPSDNLYDYFEDYQIGAENFRLGNEELIIYKHKDEIQQSFRDNQITIIEAETGVGKSTQVPQYLLEDGYEKIYITQPRRIAARNVFSRIREEISEKRGDYYGAEMVSYQTAVVSEGPEDAPSKVVTDGLQYELESHEKGLKRGEVILLDEIHEENSNIEFLLALIKLRVAKDPSLRVGIMSATVDAQRYVDYFADVCQTKPNIIKVPNRTHKVDKFERPFSTDVDETIRIVSAIPNEDGEITADDHDVLIFRPGKREIVDAIDEIKKRLPNDLRRFVKIFPLHAKLSESEQQLAIKNYPGFIKIVVSTDVAQTSLTVPGIKYVIDSGYQRRIEIDEEGTKGLMLRDISVSCMGQRSGRTGRLSDGEYYHTRLDHNTPFLNPEDRTMYPIPEVLRTDAARHTLRLKAMGYDIAEMDMLHKIPEHFIAVAKENLQILGAFDENCDITPVGRKMNKFPLSASSARIMVESLRHKQSIVRYCAALTASHEAGGLQYYAHNVGKRWQELTSEETSDLLVQLDIFIAAQTMTNYDIKSYDLDINNVQRAQEQFFKVAKRAGLKVDQKDIMDPPTPEEREEIRECIVAGYLPTIFRNEGDGVYSNARKPTYKKRQLSKRSLAADVHELVVGDPYNIEIRDGEEIFVKHSIENVTVVTARMLGNVASSQVIYKPEEYLNREGKFFQRERQYLFDVIDLGIIQEVPAEPSPQLRQEIIKHAIENPGAAQKQLRQLKKDLETLNHYAKTPVKKLTQDKILELINQAAPDDITTPSKIEDNLREMIADPDMGLSINHFVSDDMVRQIVENAPRLIEVESELFNVRYRNGQPLVSNYDKKKILDLESDSVYLPDDREVLFVYKNEDGRRKNCKLFELKNRLRDECA